MRLNKKALLALVAAAMVLPAPAVASDRETRSERRAERYSDRDTPYSNRSVRREREERRIAREIERDSRPTHYRFKSERERAD